jgi:excisionase family DNA binding protein
VARVRVKLLRVREVAERLSIHPNTVYEMAMRGELPRVKVRTAVRVPESALEEWIAAHTEPGPAS